MKSNGGFSSLKIEKMSHDTYVYQYKTETFRYVFNSNCSIEVKGRLFFC